MENKERRYFYPIRDPKDPESVMLVEITEKEYRRIYPSIWHTQKYERKLGRCACTENMLWKCDADCLVCPYHRSGKILSLDCEYGILGNHPDTRTADHADIVLNRLFNEKVLSRLQELYPEALDVGKQKLMGDSERAAIRALHLIRTSYRRHVKEIREILEKEFGDFL